MLGPFANDLVDCESSEVFNLEGLKTHLAQHLKNKEKDPLIRHVCVFPDNVMFNANEPKLYFSRQFAKAIKLHS